MDHPTADDLTRSPLLAALDPTMRAALAERFEVEDHKEGHRIVTEGQAGYAFYVIASGAASVTHEGRELRTLGPGEYFGEISILGEGRRTATVTATEPTVVWALFGTTFRTMQMSQPDVAEALQTAMRDRLAAG